MKAFKSILGIFWVVNLYMWLTAVNGMPSVFLRSNGDLNNNALEAIAIKTEEYKNPTLHYLLNPNHRRLLTIGSYNPNLQKASGYTIDLLKRCGISNNEFVLIHVFL